MKLTKPLSPTDYKILVICDDGGKMLSVREIFSLLVNGYQINLNYGYLCNKCSALAKVGWLTKGSKDYGNKRGQSVRGWPSFYKTTRAGIEMTKKYQRWKITHKQKSTGSSNSDIRNYL